MINRRTVLIVLMLSIGMSVFGASSGEEKHSWQSGIGISVGQSSRSFADTAYIDSNTYSSFKLTYNRYEPRLFSTDEVFFEYGKSSGSVGSNSDLPGFDPNVTWYALGAKEYFADSDGNPTWFLGARMQVTNVVNEDIDLGFNLYGLGGEIGYKFNLFGNLYFEPSINMDYVMLSSIRVSGKNYEPITDISEVNVGTSFALSYVF